MEYDLKKINSHPGKTLKQHIEGIQKKAKRRAKNKILDLAILFHDLGKINPNFQNKLKGKNSDLYSNHSYLSAFAFFKFIEANKNYFNKELGEDKNLTKIITAIIVKHHGNLPNFDSIFSSDELCRLKRFLNENKNLPICIYLKEEFNFKSNFFNLEFEENNEIKATDFVKKSLINKKFKYCEWQKDAMNYYTATQFNFACLIEADKRDAGNLENLLWFQNDDFRQNEQILNDNLTKKFESFPKKNITALNKKRKEIRIDAISKLKEELQLGNRTFQLSAPTGAGKTLCLLDIARTIGQEKEENLGIIYCLPFLSIIDQVEKICTEDLKLEILAATSKNENQKINQIQEKLESNPGEVYTKALLEEIFKAQTFDHSFILTTFVQFFETLVSNRNSTLLKLPNFSNRIFLIDEIQALTPSMYIFFAAWLDDFCKKHNSYVVYSSATMPNFNTPENYTEKFKTIFKDYKPPKILLNQPKKYFHSDVFNRYEIKNLTANSFCISDLKEHIIQQKKSCLIILNTIADTKVLFNELKDIEKNIVLLNTHFVPEDRLKKIEIAKKYLNKHEKIILISTQLIEAGVDISFPIVYRDLCLLPSLIQSAGRCNRIGKKEKGLVYFIELLKHESEKISAHSIYRSNNEKEYLKQLKDDLRELINEKDLLCFQEDYFKKLSENLIIGAFEVYEYEKNQNEKQNMLDCINKAEFETMGKYKLIPKQLFGEEYNCYIPLDEKDLSFKKLEDLSKELKEADTYSKFAQRKNKIAEHLKKMRKRVVTFRIYNKEIQEVCKFSTDEPIYGIYELADLKNYTFQEGINLSTENQIL